jgi:hypothetical protein
MFIHLHLKWYPINTEEYTQITSLSQPESKENLQIMSVRAHILYSLYNITFKMCKLKQI